MMMRMMMVTGRANMMVIPQAAPLNLNSIHHSITQIMMAMMMIFLFMILTMIPMMARHGGHDGDDGDDDDGKVKVPDDHSNMWEEYGKENADDDGGRVDCQDVPHPFLIKLSVKWKGGKTMMI